MDSLKQIDALTDNIIDMYIPMMDLADMSYDFHREQGKLIATECEEIISKLLNLIAVFMKKTTCMRNKDVLKHYYNRYCLLKFCGGKLDNFAELNMKLQETFIYSYMEIYIMKICSSFKALHYFISEFDNHQTFISKAIFFESLKKMESCMICVIFILNLEFKMKDVLSDLEGMHAKISF